ncbi:hypothetical protein K66PH128C1_LOCUS28 [Klebsiella phage vB_Ko_K66PH128C1]|uniref:Uncharacterized protein n=1 Tax=Klebsiella phage vB_Ko_K66PH128C1 TaxID=3071610 RepID=A0AAD2GTB3_9CAUD|nr:hypothetical protein K66PH128C1_LOCUS28 [Klebsiella phage vB_Ko_K66PH128C1]
MEMKVVWLLQVWLTDGHDSLRPDLFVYDSKEKARAAAEEHLKYRCPFHVWKARVEIRETPVL